MRLEHDRMIFVCLVTHAIAVKDKCLNQHSVYQTKSINFVGFFLSKIIYETFYKIQVIVTKYL